MDGLGKDEIGGEAKRRDKEHKSKGHAYSPSQFLQMVKECEWGKMRRGMIAKSGGVNSNKIKTSKGCQRRKCWKVRMLGMRREEKVQCKG